MEDTGVRGQTVRYRDFPSVIQIMYFLLLFSENAYRTIFTNVFFLFKKLINCKERISYNR